MKTLINKNNPQIRITAEVETLYDKSRCVKYYYIKDLRLGLLQENWTLVEEEPAEDWREKRKKECPFRIADGCKQYAGVISECTGICSWVVDYPKLKEIQDKKEQEQPDVDLEKEIRKHADLFQADIEYPLRLTAIKFYELGRKGGGK